MRFLAKVLHVLDWIIDGGGVIGGALLFFLVINITWEVIARYFLGHGTIWSLEVAEYALLYFPFLVAAFVLKREGHVKLDLILSRLNPKKQYLLNGITSIIIVIICLFLIWYGTSVTLRLFKSGDTTATALMVPKFILVAVIPFGGFLLFIQSIRRAYDYLRKWREPVEYDEKSMKKPENQQLSYQRNHSSIQLIDS